MHGPAATEIGALAEPASGAKRRGKLGLTARITLAASALTLAFLTVIGSASYHATRSHITRTEGIALDNHAALLAGRLATTLGSVVSTLGPLAHNALVLNSLMDSLTRETSLVPFLEDFSTVNGIPVEITLVDFEGKPVAGNSGNARGAPELQQVVLGEGVPFATVRRGPAGLHLLVIQPVFYQRTSSPEGALIHRIELPQALFSASETNEAVRLLSHGTSVLETPRRWADPSQDATHVTRVRTLDLPPILAPLDLAIELVADPSTVRASLEELFRLYVLIAAAMIVATILLSALAARRLTRPLLELEEVATAVVASGSFQHKFDASGAPEVSRLADAFNRMLEKLGIAYAKLESEARLESQRREQLTKSNLRLQAEVTDRRRAEADAKQARRLLADAIENMTDGFALFDDERRLVLCNETYRGMFPLMSDDLVTGVHFEELIARSSQRGQFQRVQHAETGEPVDRTDAWRGNVPVELLTREGRWILARDRVTGRGALVGARIDITERKNSEQALAAHAAELARSNAELEQFAYVASHDLQEPLRKVHAFSDLLEMDCADQVDDTGREYLRRIRSACGRMQRLIEDLLTFSRMSRAEQTQGPVELDGVIEQVVSDLSLALSESDARVEADDLPVVTGDPVHMGQLFQNLIGNAIKYRREGVAPMVRIGCTRGAPGCSESRENASRHRLVELSVQDNGIGFDQKYAERVFGVFQRLHGVDKYKGTGIGLAICRKIVESHGGTIRAISEPGVGTEIRFTLPLAEPLEVREAS